MQMKCSHLILNITQQMVTQREFCYYKQKSMPTPNGVFSKQYKAMKLLAWRCCSIAWFQLIQAAKYPVYVI